MEISVDKVLMKMADEVSKARSDVEKSKLRERLIAIRTLCDVILDEKSDTDRSTPQVTQTVYHSPVTQKTVKLVDEGGNGDSLFDF